MIARRFGDDPDPIGFAEHDQFVHRAGIASKMHCNDRACPRRHHRGHGFGIQILRIRIDIGEDRCCTAGDDAARRCDEAARGHDHFIAGPDAERAQRKFERERAIGERNCVRHVAHRRKSILERMAMFAMMECVDAARLQDVDHRRDLVLGIDRPA